MPSSSDGKPPVDDTPTEVTTTSPDGAAPSAEAAATTDTQTDEEPTKEMNPLRTILNDIQRKAAEEAALAEERKNKFEARLRPHITDVSSNKQLRRALETLGAHTVASIIPDSMTLERFLRTPGLELNKIERICKRGAECRKCPPHGGACDADMARGVHAQYVEEKRAVEFVPCERYRTFKIWEYLGFAGVWERYRLDSLAEFQARSASEAAALTEINRYVERWHASVGSYQENLIIQGPQSLDKTRLVQLVMRELHVRSGTRGMQFWTMPEFLHEVDGRRDADSLEQFHSRAKLIRLVALDGIHSYVPSEQQRGEIERFVGARYADRRPWIITTAVPLEDLVERLGSLTVERLTSQATRVMVFEKLE